MPKRKPIPPKTLIEATTASVKGKSILAIESEFEVSNRAARHMAQVANISKEEYLDGVRDNMRAALGQVAERLSREIDQLSTSQLAVVGGILTDKLQILESNQPPAPTAQVNIQINGVEKTREEVIGGLYRNMGEVDFQKGEPVDHG